MILRNHGTLAIGSSVGEAWLGIYNLERACAVQVMTRVAGVDAVLLPSEESQETVRQQTLARRQNKSVQRVFDLAWQASLRKLDRHLPGYAD